MSWNTGLFDKDDSTFTPAWSAWNSQNQDEAYKYDYFEFPGGKLGNREVRSNKNLLNPNEFAKYWQTGKHKAHKIYKDVDLDGDGQYDMIAVDPSDKVVGFNDRYVVESGNAETPYKRAYYQLPKSERALQSYQQFLEDQPNIPGWKDLDKFKESRKKALHKVILEHFEKALDAVNIAPKPSNKEKEIISKQLIPFIASTYFATDVPLYQVKIITASPEFKKILNTAVTSETVKNYFPAGEQNTQQIAFAMVKGIRGLGDGGVKKALKDYADTLPGNRLAKEPAETLYVKFLAKQAASAAFKKHHISPMYLIEHPDAATAFRTEVDAIMKEMDAKHKMEEIKAFK